MPKKASPAPKPRKPGRPAVGSGVPRDALVDVAARLFAARGIGATTLKEVAAAAHATPALLHYYFGNKDQLADAVMTERMAPVLFQATAPLRAECEFEIAALVESYTRTVAAHPWVPQLLVREVLSDGGALRERFIARIAKNFAAPAPLRVARAQAAGRVRRDLEPRLVVLSIVSLLAFPFVAAPVWREVLGFAPGPAFVDTLIRHTTAVLAHGVAESPHANRRKRA